METNRIALHERKSRPKSTFEIVLINLLSYLIFLGIAFLVLWPQISQHAFIAGTDSAFHMNRIYETAMQIKTGHFSYFQSLFGFHQTGRIVNAFYGPVMAYLCGLLLLICKTWLNFQVVSSLLVLSLSGWLMYILCVKNRVQRWASLVIGTLYLTSYPISVWPTAQKFMGIGAVLLPLVILCGTRMLRNHQVNVVSLAVIEACLVQTHLLSSILATLALVPMFIVGWLTAEHKGRMFVAGVKALALTILLTGNVWGVIVDLFTTNHIIPVFPEKSMIQGTLNFSAGYFNFMGPVLSIVVLLDLLAMIGHWRRYSYRWKTVTLAGLFFLWLSSAWFPWAWVHRYLMTVTNVIQFPLRFLGLAIVLLLLAFGRVCSVELNSRSVRLRYFKPPVVKAAALLVMLVAAITGLRSVIGSEADQFATRQVLNQPLGLVHVNQADPQRLRADYRSRDLLPAIRDVVKSTPDYLPSSSPMASNRDYYQAHPYHLENVQLDSQDQRVHRQIQGRDQLVTKWRSRTATQQSVPVVAYRQTRVRVNGKLITHPRITPVGALLVRARPGLNRVEVTYHPDLALELVMWIAVIAWLVLLIRVGWWRYA